MSNNSTNIISREQKRQAKKLFKEGLKQYQRGYYEESVKIFDDAIKINPYDYQIWIQKGVILDKLQKHEEAISAYEEAIKVDSNQTSAYYNKGLALKDLQKYEEAITAFDDATKINITHLSAHFEKALIYDKLENYPEAIRRYEAILDIKPNSNAVRYKLNIALEKQGKIANAWKNRIK